VSKQTTTVKQHAIKELKLAAKIALCFLSIWFILLIWAFKGVYWGLISSIIFVFVIVCITFDSIRRSERNEMRQDKKDALGL